MASTVTSGAGAARDLGDPALYVNRELDWLEFNARVLAMAADEERPLLERCKFLAIFSSNLDEFFMVRVAGIQDALAEGRRSSTPDKLPRGVVLDRIAARSRQLVLEQSLIWSESVLPALHDADLPVVDLHQVPNAGRKALDRRFEREIFPVLTPLAVGPGATFPYISGLSLNIGLNVTDPVSGESRLARVKVPPGLPRFLVAGGMWVPIEQVIEANLGRLFPGMELGPTTRFRVTRDADIDISDEAEDLMGAVEDQLKRRRFGHAVRLEIQADAHPGVAETLRDAHRLTERDVYRIPAPLDLTSLWEMASLDRPDLLDQPWQPRTPAHLRGDSSEPRDMFASIRSGDILVHHPYEDFDTSVGRFIEQAADDPDVLAVKQTIYRTTGDGPIIPALMRAAEAGKQTVCVAELQARFDEERNIRWARRMERAGVHTVYGEAGFKTHAKLSMVVRREGDRVRRYVHVGTGNYNPRTARLYTDLGLFTCDDEIGEDVADLFNSLTGFGHPPAFRRALVAPAHLRDGIIAEIDRVAAAHAGGVPGRVVLKCNAIIDRRVIEALYRASETGVAVDLIVRSICGLRPGLEGVSDNIRVVSIVGRFLEHSRIFGFTSGDETRWFIGSADMMARNLDNRVEMVVPVTAAPLREELAHLADLYLRDNVLAWELGADGEWRKRAPAAGEEPVDTHAALMERASRRAARDSPGREGAVS